MSFNEKMTAIADAIRGKTGGTDPLTLDQMAIEIEGISTGGSSEEWIGDGNTHIWITLPEGRTSPMLGVCPKGTVTVDWGDGTTPDVLTGTSTSTVKWTPTHNYAKPGDYVITLTVDGEMDFYGSSSNNANSGILRHSSSASTANFVYQQAVKRVEVGFCVTSIGTWAFANCHNIKSINIPNSVTNIDTRAFGYCYSLTSINIPNSVTHIGSYAFADCYSLTSINIPNSVTSIGEGAFQYCYGLTSLTIPNSVMSIETKAFNFCYNLKSIDISNSVTSIGESVFSQCYSLASINIPDGAISIGNTAFQRCLGLASIDIPDSVTTIGNNAFAYCGGMRYFDFTHHTKVVTLSSTNAFTGISADCEIRVPAALYDQWKAATNWTTYASQIVAV